MQGRPSSSRPSTSARPTTAFDRDQFQQRIQQQQPHEIEEESDEESEDEDVFAFLPPTTADKEQQSTSQSPFGFAAVPYPEPTFDPWGRQYPISRPGVPAAPPGIHDTSSQTHPHPHPYNKPPSSPSTDPHPSTGMSGPDLYRLNKLGTAASSKLGTEILGMPQAASSVADSLSMTQSMMEEGEGRSIKWVERYFYSLVFLVLFLSSSHFVHLLFHSASVTPTIWPHEGPDYSILLAVSIFFLFFLLSCHAPLCLRPFLEALGVVIVDICIGRVAVCFLPFFSCSRSLGGLFLSLFLRLPVYVAIQMIALSRSLPFSVILFLPFFSRFRWASRRWSAAILGLRWIMARFAFSWWFGGVVISPKVVVGDLARVSFYFLVDGNLNTRGSFGSKALFGLLSSVVRLEKEKLESRLRFLNFISFHQKFY